MNKITNEILSFNLNKIYDSLCNRPTKAGFLDERHKREMTQRNWAFDHYLAPRIAEYAEWLELSDEHSNYTYGLSNLHHLVGWVSCVTSATTDDATKIVQEIIDDAWLVDYLSAIERSVASPASAKRIKMIGGNIFGRRIGWYAVARLKKPKLVVETGVDRGLGSAVLCRALLKNAEEGAPGTYLGTEINPKAGYLLSYPMTEVGVIAYGDSVTTLERITDSIDLFINDSDHSPEYEAREYQAISAKLTAGSVILGDNSHATDKLFQFAKAKGMKFLHYAEQPEGHWYPGAGIGAAF